MGRTSDANERLMDAALDLIWEESYSSVTIDDICKKADVRKGSFYYFFKSKAELAEAALERMWIRESKPFMDATFSPSKNPLERIRDYLEHINLIQKEICAKHGKVLGCPIMSMGTETSTQEIEQVNHKVREIFTRKRRYYESAIRDAVAEKLIPSCDPSEKACALASLIDGMLCQCRVLNDLSQLGSLPSIGLGLLTAQTAASASKA